MGPILTRLGVLITDINNAHNRHGGQKIGKETSVSHSEF